MHAEIKQIHIEIAENADKLLACLNQELETLNSNDYKALVSIANEKQVLIQLLDNLDKKRQSLSPDSDYSEYLKQLDITESLVNDWNQILEKIKQCNHQNEINGRLINRMNQIARETLDLFTGRDSNADVTYSPEGLKQGMNTRLTNTRA